MLLLTCLSHFTVLVLFYQSLVSHYFTSGSFIHTSHSNSHSVHSFIHSFQLVIDTQYFGERALINEEPRTATVTAATPVTLMALDKDAFDELLGPLQRVMDRRVRENTQRQQERCLHVHLQGDSTIRSSGVNHTELVEVAVLGSGGFGRVTLVRHKPTDKVFALKAMIKSAIVQQDYQNNVLNEKRSMQLCAGHPFIIELHLTFKDSKRLYMLLEFVQGGELLSRIEASNGLTDSAARFYR